MTGALPMLATYGGGLIGRAMRAADRAHVLSREGTQMLAELEAEAVTRLDTRLDQLAIPPLPIDTSKVLAAIGAGDVELAILAVLAAVETEPSAQRLANYVAGAIAGQAMPVGLIDLALGPDHRRGLLAAVARGAPLREHHLIEVVEPIDSLGRAATIRLAPRTLRWVAGSDPRELDPEVAGFATRLDPTWPSTLGPAARDVVAELVGQIAVFVEHQRPESPADVLLRGPAGSGRGEIAREACRRLGLVGLEVRASAMLAEDDPAGAAGALVREALLTGAVIIVEDWHELDTDDRGRRVRSELAPSSRVVIATASTDPLRSSPIRRALELDVPLPPAAKREALWAESLPASHVSLAPEIASLYRVGIGAIARISAGTATRAELHGKSSHARQDLGLAVRTEFEADIGTLAERREVTQTWDDLVLPEDTLQTVHEIIDQHRQRATVLGRWGFARKLGRGTGTIALFSGDPGTGKSMVAGLIARELGLDLYQIDLSRVLSKWLGESEKQLARLFDAAETGHVMLLFDEADALLARRSADPKSSNDRYANVETNYLLTRLEAFQGLAILTSNLEGSIDPALSRRLAFDLRFGFPDEEQRMLLWRAMLPAELPLLGPIDLRLLANRFELAGGHIRNIVLRAAYLAAGSGSDGMTMAHLIRAAEAEYADRGILVARGRLA